MIEELDVVVLKATTDRIPLPAGTRGTVVHIFNATPPAYLVEFSEDDDPRGLGVFDASDNDLLLCLRRYWITFKPTAEPSVLNLGCGVTTRDRGKARELIEQQVFPVLGVRSIQEIIEDIDISTLDANHVRPNMGDPTQRGVWFPLLP
ncbi:MAG TPA: DUF4926 domain-containing protein [Reyranella sp.]|nr:DUF4926 domain-containing protein [Reyranella sp.]